MSVKAIIASILAGIAYVAFLVYEIVTAPTIDRTGRVVGGKTGRRRTSNGED